MFHPQLSRMTDDLNVVFAPDWRSGVPYQELLAKALERHNVSLIFGTVEPYKGLEDLIDW
jgi:hypothetical protein